MLCSITPFGFWFHADLGYVELGIYQLSKSHIRFGMDPRFDSAIRGSYRSFYHVLPTVLTFHSITFWFCISKNRKVGRITDGIAISVNVRYLFNVTQFIWNNNLCPNYLFTAVLAFHLITIASKAPWPVSLICRCISHIVTTASHARHPFTIFSFFIHSQPCSMTSLSDRSLSPIENR